VIALVRVEQQCPGHRVQHLRRGVDVASLLEPRVPGDADAGQRGDLLAAQARRAAPGGGRQADLLRRDPLAPAAQESGQLLAAVRELLPAIGGIVLMVAPAAGLGLEAILSVARHILLTVGKPPVRGRDL
jgi:hypothetical protein